MDMGRRGRGQQGLDDLDLEILRILQDNARTPLSEVAKRVGAPEATVRYRVRRMEEAGVIRGYHALLDPAGAGFPLSLIILVDADPERADRVFDAVGEMPEVTHVFMLTGKYNVVAIFHARDTAHVSEIDSRVRSLEGVRAAESLLVTGRVRMNLRLPI